MASTLHDLLNGYYYEALVHIAEFNHIDIMDAQGRRLRKSELIEALCKGLFTPERIAQTLAALRPLERAVLDRLLLHGGEADTIPLGEELQREGIVRFLPRTAGRQKNNITDPHARKGNDFEDVIARLTLYGLVFSSNAELLWPLNAKLGIASGQRLIVPNPVRQYLPHPELPSLEWGQGSLPAPVEETDIALAQRELFLYWSIVRAKPLPLTQAGLLQKRALRSINEQLLFPNHALESTANESEAPHLYFLRLLLQELGLLLCERDQVRASGEPGQVPEFWEKPIEERVYACLQAWQRLVQWSELTNLGMSAFDIDLPRARGILLEQLRLLPAGTWLSADRFLSRLAITTPRLLFKSREFHAKAPYYADARRGMEQDRWFAKAEAAFVGGALSGPLHWLGLMDISADGNRLLAFRVNASGARVLGIASPKAAEASPAVETRLIVQPNFEVLALGPISEAILAKLEVFAERIKVDRSALVYALSRETVYRGQRHGLSVSQIISFLEEQAHASLPQNVLRTLQEWGEQHERVVFHRAVALCQMASAEALDALWNDPTAQAHLERRLTPTVALVKRGHMKALRELLLQRGMLPALSTEKDSCLGRMQATPEGELRPVHAGPDLLLETCLQGLAEQRDDRFYITESSVMSALASGMSVREYLERLASLHHGPVPAELQKRIKAWSRYYGKALLRKTVLLEVKDAATADELLADEELAPLLSRFAADPRGRLLQVHTEDLEHLHRLLRERGVEVS